LALDDVGLHKVKALVRLAPGELDGARHAGRARSLQTITAVLLVNQRVRDEDEEAVPGAGDLLGSQVRQPNGADGGRADRRQDVSAGEQGRASRGMEASIAARRRYCFVSTFLRRASTSAQSLPKAARSDSGSCARASLSRREARSASSCQCVSVCCT